MKIRNFLPPILADSLERLVGRLSPGTRRKVYWKNIYRTWDEAASQSKGYNDPEILRKVSEAVIKVKKGEAAYERDGVLFDEYEYNWPLLTYILSKAGEQNGKVHIVDFGGSLGSVYFQHIHFFSKLESLKWSIVEQPHYVREGNTHFADGKLHFYETIANAVADRGNIDIIIFSASIQYIKQQREILDDVIRLNIPFVMLERLSVTDNPSGGFIANQYVKSDIVVSSYPIYFYTIAELDGILKSYNRVYEGQSLQDPLSRVLGSHNLYWKSIYYQLPK